MPRPPSFISSTYVDYHLMTCGWNEGSFMRSNERLDSEFMRSNQRIELEGDLFHSLMSLTQEKNYAHDTLFHFLMSLTQENELLLRYLVSIFKDLDTRQGTLL